MMQTWGAEVFASPSMETHSGRAALAEDPDNPGSLGLAISEAVEDAASRADTNYALGSVLNHVLLHQTVIGLEAKKQFEKAGTILTRSSPPAAAAPTSAARPSLSSPTRPPARACVWSRSNPPPAPP